MDEPNAEEFYILPSHPSVLSSDPLSVCDDESPPTWTVVNKTISAFRAEPKHTIHQLPQLIEDLSYSIKMDGNVNTRFLARFLTDTFPDPDDQTVTGILDSILDAAISLPVHFPNHTLRYLGVDNSSCGLQSSQISALLAHQILNTLSPPPSNDWGCTFSIWYSDPQPLKYAVMGYLHTIFDFFSQNPWTGINIFFDYHVKAAQPDLEDELVAWKKCMEIKVFSNVVFERTSHQLTPFPHGQITCTLVASNKSPGFGPSCTQEELVTAACPPLLLLGALFIRPPIPSNAALIAHGNMPAAQWRGQGRYARHQGTSPPRHRTFLFLDAAELDIASDTLPDLRLDVLIRDLHKVYTGFVAVVRSGQENIASPLWGAGSFGGDPIIKCLILAAGAARAGIKVHLAIETERSLKQNTSVDTNPTDLFSNLEKLRDCCAGMSVGELVDKLTARVAKDITNTAELLDYLLP